MPPARKLRSWALGALLALTLLVFLARDLGESARVRTLDAAGTHLPTKVWFVEDGPDLIVRGTRGADWIERLEARPRGDVVFPGQRADFRASFIERGEIAGWDDRFREKYGWLDRLDAVRRAIPPSGTPVMVRLSPTYPRRS